MRRPVQALLLLLAGGGLIHACVLTDLYLRYVKEGMRPFLICSGLALLAAGMAGAARDGFPFLARSQPAEIRNRGTERAVGDEPGHSHHRAPRVAWLLFLPVLALLFAPPPALGSYTAARQSAGSSGLPEDENPPVAPLSRKDPAPLSLTEFTIRARQDGGGSLRDHTVLLTGFVTPGRDGAWHLTRMIVNCCAADSLTVKVRMRGAAAPPADRWLAVTGTLHRPVSKKTPVLNVKGTKRIPAPASPYSDSTPVNVRPPSPGAG